MTDRSWGLLPVTAPAQTLGADWRFADLPPAAEERQQSFLPFGRRRSYGDSCQNSNGIALDTRRLSRFIRFDAEQGLLECESGVTLDEILRLVVPRGWFLPVVPGTRYVSVGGAIANDVHGKNHHMAGSFGCHVESLTLLRSDGSRPACSATDNPELFAATVGGLGLTGLITRASIRLRRLSSDQLDVEDLPFQSLPEFLQLSEQSNDWDYTVAWFDTIPRRKAPLPGIFSRARHAHTAGKLHPGRDKPLLGVPFTPPLSLVNRWSVDIFNRLYHTAGRRKPGVRRRHYQPCLFPLDGINHWNRMYGRRGFYQYQCVVPAQGCEESLGRLLELMISSREASFLAVLKAFGSKPSPGMLSFPRPGLTLALDFPNRGDRTLRLLDAFDEIVRDYNGALYPAKDARMPAGMFQLSYPRLEEFIPHMDPNFSSSFWRRMHT